MGTNDNNYMQASEKNIQDAIIQLFKTYGLYVQRMNSGLAVNYYTNNFMAQAEKGHSDLVACDKQNRLSLIEVKTPTGVLSDDQVRFLREQHNKHRRWAVCTSYEDAMRFLDDENYHGADKYVLQVTDESRKYISPKAHSKKSKASMADVNAFMAWDEKHR